MFDTYVRLVLFVCDLAQVFISESWDTCSVQN